MSNPINITSSDIHIWCAYNEQITDPELLRSYNQILSKAEHEQQKRFRFFKDRHQYLITRALVRQVLSSDFTGAMEF